MRKITILVDNEIVRKRLSCKDHIRDKCNPLKIQGKLRKICSKELSRKLAHRYENVYVRIGLGK